LLLGSDEQDASAVCDHVANELVRRIYAIECLLKIDDVDTVALTKNESLHSWIPTVRLMSEVNACFKHLAHADDCHDYLLSCG
jgi:hypothetical protein